MGFPHAVSLRRGQYHAAHSTFFSLVSCTVLMTMMSMMVSLRPVSDRDEQFSRVLSDFGFFQCLDHCC
jgi:uncharacterized BrkB/YihY/UPF0761 family membrane protein